MSIKFASKAQNLRNLQGILKSGEILPLLITNLKEVESDFERLKDRTLKLGDKFIIRSSSKSEDSKIESNAGAFLSIANVREQNLQEALRQVADSMPNVDDEILVQTMLENIEICGVAFSVDKDNFAPYFCIQYDTSGSNSAITDGSSKDIVSYFHYRDSKPPKNENLKKIIEMILELESLYEYKALDIEFAISKGTLYCLQVRPLVMENKENLFNALPLEALKRLEKRFISLQKATPDVFGDRAIFGVMPDWNPAEIIGLKPKRLALSLYKEIVTDNIWAYQRDNYGYLNLRSHPLMHSFLGIPYIDVRLSFNSFIPKSLDKNIANKLVNYYLDKLAKSPHLHDKIEFDIVFSCYDFNTSKKLKQLLQHGFNENEIKRLEFSLLNLTNLIIKHKKGLYLKDIKKIKKLAFYYDEILNSNLSNIDKIYWLLESTKRYGTLPFAGIARAGFIAISLLNSLVEIGFFSIDEKNTFLNSLNTISKKLSNYDLKDKEGFLKEFGHLRAGTYNILSPRYDEAFSDYFSDIKVAVNNHVEFKISDEKKIKLEGMLSENGLSMNVDEFFRFLKVAIEGREYAKFEFTKLLSMALKLIGELGEYYGIDKEDMAHLDIKNILTLYSSLYSKSPKNRFLDEIKKHKEEYELTLALKLPQLLRDSSEIFGFFSQMVLPNFISQKCISAKVAKENDTNLEGKIVLIYAADPGYDYLFTKNIAGFITCYGGANSHMAIRASELGMPAVIGVGEESFKKYLQATNITIDCQSEQIICL